MTVIRESESKKSLAGLWKHPPLAGDEKLSPADNIGGARGTNCSNTDGLNNLTFGSEELRLNILVIYRDRWGAISRRRRRGGRRGRIRFTVPQAAGDTVQTRENRKYNHKFMALVLVC